MSQNQAKLDTEKAFSSFKQDMSFLSDEIRKLELGEVANAFLSKLATHLDQNQDYDSEYEEEEEESEDEKGEQT